MGLLPTEIAETKSRRAREREELSGPPWLPGGGPRAVSPNNPFIDEQPLQSSGRSWGLWLCDTSHQCRNRRFGWRRLRVCLLGNTRDVFRSGFLHRAETGAGQRAWGQSKVALKKCHLLCPSGRGAVEMPSPLTCDLIPTFFLGLPSKKRPIVCQLMPWPSSLPPVSSAAPIQQTRCRAFRTSVKQPRKSVVLDDPAP